VLERFYALLLIFLAFYAQKMTAQNNLNTNFREMCRKTISGQYSNALADFALAQDSVTLAKEAIKKLAKLISSDESKLSTVSQKLKASEYSPNLIHERDALVSQIKLYKEQLMTTQKQLTSSQNLHSTSKKRVESIRKKVESIFNISMVADPEGGPRKLLAKVDWKSPCPKYRVLCPLPIKDVNVLKELTKELDDSELACERYTKIK
jgi:hypothetical protein